MGGVWNYCPGPLKLGLSASVPQLSPYEPLEKPIWTEQSEGLREANFVSPLYDRLETNIPKELMRYSDKAWPADAQLFPRHSTVKQYLEEYAEDVKNYIQFHTQVLDVSLENPATGHSPSNWKLTTRNLQSGKDTTNAYDAVVVASGHFTVPYVPEVEGIQGWNTAYPGIISHSKFYDSPEYFRGKKVIVVGSSASALDIGAQINECSQGRTSFSQRTQPWMSSASAEERAIYPEIIEFLPSTTHDRAVRFADGRIEEHLDHIVFCTGYFYSYPFLSSLSPPVVTHGWRTMNIYQQLFYIENPTLVFPVLSQRVIPFPMAENHAALFSRVWSGRLTLPSKQEMKAWEIAEVEAKGNGKKFHMLPYPMDADYLNHVYDWAEVATPRFGLSNNGKGKLGTRWSEKQRWMRALFPEIRRAFVQRGNERSQVKTLTELGFVFEMQREEEAI